MKEQEVGALQEFCYETIPMFDSKVPVAINLEIKEALKDLQNRPWLEDKRTITIKIDIKPVKDQETGDLDALVQIHVTPASKPLRSNEPQKVALQHNATRAFFNADTPGRPRAGGLFDEQTIPISDAVANRKKD